MGGIALSAFSDVGSAMSNAGAALAIASTMTMVLVTKIEFHWNELFR
jgi:hypothetical protein